MPHRTWRKEINVISATLCYFSLNVSVKINWIPQSTIFKTNHRVMKVPQLVSLLCAGRVCPDAKSLEQFNMTSYVWQNLCESSFLCSHHFLLECHSLPSAWISCSWGEVQSLNTTRETNCRYVLWGKLVVSGSVQDDVTILPTATHCASVCSAVVSAVASLQLCVRERVEGSRQECHWISLGLV